MCSMPRGKKESETTDGRLKAKQKSGDGTSGVSEPAKAEPVTRLAPEAEKGGPKTASTPDRPAAPAKGKQAEPAKKKIIAPRGKQRSKPEPDVNPLREEMENIGAEGPARSQQNREDVPTSEPASTIYAAEPTRPARFPADTKEEAAPAAESSKELSIPSTHTGSPISEQDLFLFNEGTHHSMWEKLGSHRLTREERGPVHFAVWAPSAREVSVVGDFNGWAADAHRMQPIGSAGIWETIIPDVARGTVYKYRIVGPTGHTVLKTDPYGIFAEVAPKTASVVWDLDYEWNDEEWMKSRAAKNSLQGPMSVYEVHLGSWRRRVEEGNRSLSYRELAVELADYVSELGFTHVEFLPVMEHPFFGSWGYQSTGFFAASSRFGTPQDLMYLIDVLHQRGIGVLFDWVPSHFPTDEHGLSYFDGTHLYEHADPRQGFHPDWNSLIFNYGRNEVRSFLLSSAMFWLKVFHADGLRVDAVASMLYLDYSRKEGEWIPNDFGGRENLEAIHFLRRLNEDVYKVAPDTQTIAEESTSWPSVSRPTYIGGLGFGMKWDMGWMHDTLQYISKDPIHRRFHHNSLTFRMLYAFSENFVLPLSHDEVVHGKGSLINKMPGDEWQKFANLRLLFAYMYAQPGKKLIFMGGEFAQWREWAHDEQLNWELLGYPSHAGMQRWIADLNRAYRELPAMHQNDMDPSGFEWIDCCDTEQSVISLIRKSRSGDVVVSAFNFTPIPRNNYMIGVTGGGMWREILNSDASLYWGSGQGNLGGVEAAPIRVHGRSHSLTITIPPLGAVFFAPESTGEEGL
jgi:1,4-alpha-glucan branching enzyme